MPVISYSSPKTYTAGVAIAPLAPTSSGVASPGYRGVSVNIGSGFSGPQGVAVDAAGNVYVADTQNNQVKKIPAAGGKPVILGSGFNQPAGVAVDAAGNIYVADFGNDAVKEIPVGGGAIITLVDDAAANFSAPVGIAVDAAGNVYVTDTYEAFKIPAGGGTPVRIGAFADGYGAPSEGIAVDAVGNVYVANSYWIAEIPASGGRQFIIPGPNSSATGVAVAASGNIYVADAYDPANGVQEFAVGSAVPISVGSGYNSPFGIAVGPAGNVYVADNGDNNVKEITPAGGYYISGLLPVGLSFNNATGVISGTPTASIPATNYTITAYNSSGHTSATVAITVNLPPLPAISYSSPQTYTQGTAITALSPTSTSVGSPGYSAPPVTLASGFNTLQSVAVDTAGNVYTSDINAGVVNKIPAGGGAKIIIGSFSSPGGVAVDAAGNVYVANNDSIQEIKAAGGAPVNISQWSGFNDAAGIALDRAGDIYVICPGSGVFEIPAGGGSPVYLGALSGSVGLAVDGAGNIYSVILGGTTVQEFPASGGPPVTIGTGFGSTTGVAVDANGSIYVSDSYNEIWKIAPGGSPVPIGSGFNTPEGVAVDAVGNVYVADSYNNAVKKIKLNGGYYLNRALPPGLNFNNTTGVISGTPLVSSPATNYAIAAYNPAGFKSAIVSIKVNPLPLPTISYASPQAYVKNTAITALKPTSKGVAAAAYSNTPGYVGSGFDNPTDVAVDARGNVYIADQSNNVVKKIPAGGGAPVIIGSGFSGPGAVAVDAKGNVYVADLYNNAIKEIPVSGATAPVTIGSGFSHPSGVAVDAAGNVYVADYGNGLVKKIPAGGGIPVAVGSGFYSPDRVAVDAAGNVYVTDELVIDKIPVGGGPTVAISSGAVYPQGITIDAEGNVFYTDAANNAVEEIPVGGGAQLTIGSGFSDPSGVAVDGAGNLYVADRGNNFVEKFPPAGGYYISTSLPRGLQFDGSTGIVSGTPTVISTAKNYTVTAYNLVGGTADTLNLSVTAAATLTFAALPAKTYGAADFAPGATSTDSITYTSSNTAVATIVSGNLHIVGAGTSTITANNGTTTATQTLTVSPAALTITANNQTAIQGTALPSLTVAYTGFVNADSQNSLTTLPVAGTAATSSSAMGYYPITVTGGTSPNYTITDVAGRLTMVTEAYLQAPITTTYGNADFYTFNTATTGVTYTSSNTAVATVSSVGLVHITGSGAATITFGKSSGHLNKNVTVNPAALTITADNKTGIQGTPIPAFTFTYTGFVNGDSQSNLTDLPNATTTATSSSGTGYYPITVTGGTSPNYTITDVNGRLTMVTQAYLKAPITTTYGDADFYTFGTTTSGVTYSSSNNNVATVSQTGLIHIVSAGNTTITFGNTNGTLNKGLTVSPAALTITANNQTKTAGAANPTLTASYSGFVNGDSQSSLTTPPAITTTATTGSVAGTYPITASSAADANYTITYVAGILTVNSASGHDIALTDALLPQSGTTTSGPEVSPAVSPNGDGVNDVLTITNISKYPDNKLTVINPGGSVIFETANYDNTSNVFDGHSSSTRQMQQPGTYFYVLQYKDSGIVKTKTGFIVLKY